MALNVAVQMDPIERINIRGDSTFALLLEAQARGFPLSYYTPDRLALRDGKVSASVQPLAVRDKAGDHFTLGEGRHVALDSFDVVLLRQDPPFDLAYITSTHLLERIQPKTLVVNDPGACAQRAGKGFRHRISRSDAADADHPRPRRHQGFPRRARRHRHEAALRQRRRGGVPAAREDLNFGSLYDLFAATFREQWVVQKFLPAVKEGDKRIILVDGEFAGAINRVPAPDDLRSNMVRGGIPKATDLTAREREICARLGSTAARARAVVRRHRRDRRLSHRDQRHLAHRHPRREEFRRRRYRGADLGQDRRKAGLVSVPLHPTQCPRISKLVGRITGGV